MYNYSPLLKLRRTQKDWWHRPEILHRRNNRQVCDNVAPSVSILQSEKFFAVHRFRVDWTDKLYRWLISKKIKFRSFVYQLYEYLLYPLIKFCTFINKLSIWLLYYISNLTYFRHQIVKFDYIVNNYCSNSQILNDNVTMNFLIRN